MPRHIAFLRSDAMPAAVRHVALTFFGPADRAKLGKLGFSEDIVDQLLIAGYQYRLECEHPHYDKPAERRADLQATLNRRRDAIAAVLEAEADESGSGTAADFFIADLNQMLKRGGVVNATDWRQQTAGMAWLRDRHRLLEKAAAELEIQSPWKARDTHAETVLAIRTINILIDAGHDPDKKAKGIAVQTLQDLISIVIAKEIATSTAKDWIAKALDLIEKNPGLLRGAK